MEYLLRSILLVLLLNWGSALLGQTVEICDNAIDDDGDGLIDLNDTDCFCTLADAVSLIPNPSFEDQICCPTDRSRMDCADTWIQASVPTTDYIHTCGWMGWPGLPMPLPIPDGEGALGFRDGRYQESNGNGSDNLNWKEYAGACLTSPLRAGVSYKFKFFIGFTQQPFSPPINVTFFGTTDCANLPFDEDDSMFGCPLNGPGWQRLGVVNAFGTNEWKEMEINVTPTVDIQAMAIGPPCQRTSATESPYYFFDNLVLAEQSAFEFEIKANNQPCALNLSFEIPEYDSLSYQWYKDGIALLGATHPRLDLPSGMGKYEVVFTSSEGCKVTRPFNFSIPSKTTNIVQTICQGEVYSLGDQQLTEAGKYRDTLKSIENCDSIVQLDLRVATNIEADVTAKIFPSETYTIGNTSFNQVGTYQQIISTNAGCDSIINLTLSHYTVYFPNIFSPNGDGINDYFIINGGKDLTTINELNIFNRWGNQVFKQKNMLPNIPNQGWDGQSGGQASSEGVYLYTASLLMDDGLERKVSGMVTLVR